MIQKAFSDREKALKQNSIWKVMRVGLYWSEKRLKEVGLSPLNTATPFSAHLTRIQKK